MIAESSRGVKVSDSNGQFSQSKAADTCIRSQHGHCPDCFEPQQFAVIRPHFPNKYCDNVICTRN